MIRIRVFTVRQGYIQTAGILPKLPVGREQVLRICSADGKEEIVPELIPMPYKDVTDEDGQISATVWGFRAKLPIFSGAKYKFILDRRTGAKPFKSTVHELKFGSHSMLQNIDNSFVDAGEHIIKYVRNEIRIYDASWKMRLACRYRLDQTLRKEGKSGLIPVRRRAVKRRGRGKPVVIISDRSNRAGDNGEALFRYLMSEGYADRYDIYFAVSGDSPDYERMSEYGRVLDFGSKEYREKFLEADKIISAAFDPFFTNAFGDDFKYVADLYRFEFCFLQHGVIMDDMENMLNYMIRGFSFFCTTADKEYRSILDGNYGYTEDEVRLTGLARYDRLEDEAEKLIVFAPTWRPDLASPTDRETGARPYSELVAGSEYCRFYNDLINNEKLIETMEKQGYKGEFYLHPALFENTPDFKGNDTVRVCDFPDYNRIFRKAAVFVTDYSSTSLDFAYLGKPLIYAQFDKEAFFAQHRRPGYFDYDRDGFGPVCKTVDETADQIIALIKGGCVCDPEYRERADRFFHFRDRGNCARIAEAIFGETR